MVKIAKTAKNTFKKLSQFRLAFYKLYGEVSTCRSATVENPVERVEFHLKSGREIWTFTLSPQSFQHVENEHPLYNWYTDRNVENFLLHNCCALKPYYPQWPVKTGAAANLGDKEACIPHKTQRKAGGSQGGSCQFFSNRAEIFRTNGKSCPGKTALFYGKQSRGMVYFNLDYFAKTSPFREGETYDDGKEYAAPPPPQPGGGPR